MTDNGHGGNSSVRYEPVGEDYFANRGLRRYAGTWALLALGVGAVISGEFSGWNTGLGEAGFGGLAIATVIVAAMYVGVTYSISEMSAAMPYAGGPYAFVRSALGPYWGYLTGLAAAIEFVLTPGVIVVFIGGYVGNIMNSAFGLDLPVPIYWLIFYVVFVGINIIGVRAAFMVTMVTTAIALAVLAIFWVAAIPNFSWDLAFNIEPEPGNSTFLPFGWLGIATALPFAIWFYLAIEQVPFAAEESKNPKRDIPKAIMWGMGILLVASVLTLVLNAGVGGGAQAAADTEQPLVDAFNAIFGDGIGAVLLSLVALAGLIASFHAIIYAYGRNIYSLSRSGYFPKWMSLTHPRLQTPYFALIVGAAIHLLMALFDTYGHSWFGEEIPVWETMLEMAVFGAVITYAMQMIAFVVLRMRHAGMDRPYVSPVGIAGAVLACLIALVTLVVLILNPDFRIGLYFCLAWLVIGIAYYTFYSRKHLVRSPEEEFALKLEGRTTEMEVSGIDRGNMS